MSVRKAKVKRLAFTPPCLAVAKPEPPSGPDWVHEIKFDGYRVQALIEGKNVRFLTRNEIDWTSRFGIVVDDFAALGVETAAIDCEAVVFDDEGISRFSGLQAELTKKTATAHVQMMAFDLLYLDGRNISAFPLIERKLQLQRLITTAELPHKLLRYSSHMQGDGGAILDKACAMGLEGIVSKRASLAYHSGRIGDWTKSKCLKADPFLVIGYVLAKATTGIVGSLVLGFYENEQLVYAGRVGSGFTSAEARAMADGLSTIIVKPPPLARSLTRDQLAGVRWVEPKFVAQIAYRDVTADRLLRHASFEHFREDKRPGEITRPPSLAY